MAESTTQLAGTKRPHSDSTSEGVAPKKRKVRRRLQHVQSRPPHIEPAPQDPVFVQDQLLRSISTALVMVGFDSVKPTALEMFRSSVEEYMTKFLNHTRTSMTSSRRTKPTALDFASALALMPNASCASLLTPQLKLQVPEALAYPSIPGPDAPPEQAPDYTALLAPLLSTADKETNYIPPHFPQLPPQHAWKHTPVYPVRETDARTIRERATEEGILAEQALRRLAAAAKSGAARVEKSRLSQPEHTQQSSGRAGRKATEDAEELFGEMMKEITGEGKVDEDEDTVMQLGVDGVNELKESGVDVGMPEGLVVNWDMGGWRRGGGKKAARV